MLDTIVSLINVRCASDPILFPSSDPKRHRCLVPVIKNLGKNAAGQPIKEVITLVFWAKYAEIASLMLAKGRALCVQGVMRTFTRDNGTVVNGKKVLEKNTTVHVRGFEFGPDSMKELQAIVGANIARAKQAGLIPAQVNIGADYLLARQRVSHRPFNPAEVAQTGKFGNARVFVKGQGWMGAQAGTMTPPAGAKTEEQIRQEIANLNAMLPGTAGAQTGPVNPLAGAVSA